MSTALPLIDAVAAEATHCSYCAKLCRFTCPVAEATGRESVTPWGINREIAAAATRGTVTAQTATAVYGCTGCRACGSACLPGLDLPTHVRAARAEVVAAGLAPHGVTEAAGAPRVASDALRAGATAGADLVVFPGCASDDGDALAAILTKAGLAWDVPAEAVCCGARAADVGLAGESATRAEHARAQLAAAQRIVVMDPHCGRQLALSLAGADPGPASGPESGPASGPEPGTESGALDPRVVQLPTFLAEVVAGLPFTSGSAVVWHDPCWLGRGMASYEDARAVVRATSGTDAHEPEFTRDRARCSGGGMGFDLINPDDAAKIRDTRADELRAAGADTLPVVTACPNAAQRLRDAGLDAHDLAGWVASRLDER